MTDIINLKTVLRENGEEAVQKALSIFYSGNPDVDNFMHSNAINFSKQNIAVTYLAISETGKIGGMFAITNKVATVSEKDLSNSMMRAVRKFGVRSQKGEYNISALLIAQLGKNYRLPEEEQLKGKLLVDAAIEKAKEAQFLIGGKLLWVECEETNANAYNLYVKNGFALFAERDDGEKIYHRLIRRL